MSSFLSASNVFLIAIRLAPATNFYSPGRNWPSGSTFPVLFRLKRFSIYSDQFLQNPFYVSPEISKNRSIIHWRLLLNGFRSVLVNVTDKPFRLKNLIYIYQGLGSARPNDLYNRFQSDLLQYNQLLHRLFSPSA